MSQWARLVDMRWHFHRIGLVLFIAALLMSIAQLFLHMAGVPFAVVLGLLAMQCFMAQNFIAQIATLQARIDMMRIGRGQEPEQ